MRIALPCCLLVAGLFPVPGEVSAAPSEISELVHSHLPACRLQTDAAGNPAALVSQSGEVLDLKAATQENPAPSNHVVGYWFSPSMDFLSRQYLQAPTSEAAADVVRLLHAIWRGPNFVQQKIYQARRVDLGWVVEVEHDFTNYPGRIQATHPYELLLDRGDTVVQLRQRCYAYPGSVRIYTNTIVSVYQREINRDGGLHYPEALEKALRQAWEREKKLGMGGAKRHWCGSGTLSRWTWGFGLAVFVTLGWLLKKEFEF